MNSPTLTSAGTQLGVILGTAAYMSPEQARGAAVDKRADIWAFGVVLYEMLSGKRLFAGETTSDTLAAVLRAEIDWTALPAATPRTIRDLLRRCLERNPKNRLHDIADARIVLAEVERGDGVMSDVAPAAPPPRSRPSRAAALAAIAGLALGAGAVALWPRPRAVAAPVEPVSFRTISFSGADDRPAASPDGSLIAFVSRRTGRPRIWIKNLATGGEQVLSAGEDDDPRFSPDGSQVLFIRNEVSRPSVYRQPLVGGQAQKIVDHAQEADWSPDGARIVFTRFEDTRSQLCVAEVRSGESSCWWESRLSLFSPRFTPDGGEIAAIEAPTTGNTMNYRIVRVRKPAGGEPEVVSVTIPGPGIGSLTWVGSGRQVLFAQPENLVGDEGNAIARARIYDLDRGTSRTLFFAEHLFPGAGFTSIGRASSLNSAGPGRLVYAVQPVRERLWSGILDGRGEAGELSLLTSTEGRDRQPIFSRDGRWLLFTSNRSGNLDLWLLDRATGEYRQLTDDRAQDWDPAFTADGEGLLWSSDRGGHFEIWTARLDGSDRRQISNDGVDAENPVPSPDGRFVYHWSSNPEKIGIWRMGLDGSDARLWISGGYVFPEVSPDGRCLSFLTQEPQSLRARILFADAATGTILPGRIESAMPSLSLPVNIGRHRWAPGGRAIAYVGVDDGRRAGLFTQALSPACAPVGEPKKLTGFRPDFLTESMAFSPDGREIVLAGLELRQRLVLAENVPEIGLTAR